MANDIYIYMYLLLSFQNNRLRARSIFQSEYLLSNVSVHRSSIEANNVCRARVPLQSNLQKNTYYLCIT